jgi:hypothetical protein
MENETGTFFDLTTCPVIYKSSVDPIVYKLSTYHCKIHGDVEQVFNFIFDNTTEVFCCRCVCELLKKHIEPVQSKEEIENK